MIPNPTEVHILSLTVQLKQVDVYHGQTTMRYILYNKFLRIVFNPTNIELTWAFCWDKIGYGVLEPSGLIHVLFISVLKILTVRFTVFPENIPLNLF